MKALDVPRGIQHKPLRAPESLKLPLNLLLEAKLLIPLAPILSPLLRHTGRQL